MAAKVVLRRKNQSYTKYPRDRNPNACRPTQTCHPSFEREKKYTTRHHARPKSLPRSVHLPFMRNLAGHLRVKVTPLHAIGRDIVLLALFRSAGQGVCAGAVGNGLDLLDLLARALENLEVGGREITLTAVAGAALPPLAGLAGRIALGEDGDKVALLGVKLHAVVVLGRKVKEEAAKLELGGVDGLLGGQGLLLHAALLFLGVGGDGADHLGHEVWQAKGGKEEKEKGLLAGARSSAGCAIGTGAAFEAGKGGRCKGSGIGGRRTACNLGNECADPAHEGEDAEDGSERVSEVSKLFGDGNHG